MTTHPASTTTAEPASGSASHPAALLDRWRALAAPFTTTVGRVEDWDAASPCEGWSARDVLAHVIGTQREFLRERGHDVPAGEDEDPGARWAAHVDAVEALIADPAVAGQEFDGHFGPATVGAALVEFYGFDMVVHRWDLARSQGGDERFDARELALIDDSVDGWGEAAYAPGIFAAALAVPDGADEQTRVLARTGRRD